MSTSGGRDGAWRHDLDHLSLLALLTIRSGRLARSIAFVAASAASYVAFQLVVLDRLLGAQTENVRIAELTLTFLAVILFAAGRGRHSVLVVAAVSAATNPWILYTVVSNIVPRSSYRLPVLGDVIAGLPQTLHFAAVALAFLAFPLGSRTQLESAAAPRTATGVGIVGQ